MKSLRSLSTLCFCSRIPNDNHLQEGLLLLPNPPQIEQGGILKLGIDRRSYLGASFY